MNAENVDLATLPKDLDMDNILIMNLDVAYLKFAWKLQKATCTLNIKWLGEPNTSRSIYLSRLETGTSIVVVWGLGRAIVVLRLLAIKVSCLPRKL